jgi:predicted metal-binding integral membrane protein DUF2182
VPSHRAFFGVSALFAASAAVTIVWRASMSVIGRDADARRLDDVDGVLILLVIGVVDLRAMAVVAAAMTVERLAPAGERVARASGAVVVGAGLFLIARAAGPS